jgi:hypothetical protein
VAGVWEIWRRFCWILIGSIWNPLSFCLRALCFIIELPSDSSVCPSSVDSLTVSNWTDCQLDCYCLVSYTFSTSSLLQLRKMLPLPVVAFMGVLVAVGYIFRKMIAKLLRFNDMRKTDDTEHMHMDTADTDTDDRAPLLSLAPHSVELVVMGLATSTREIDHSPKGAKELSMADIPFSSILTLFINGAKVELNNPDPAMLLATFIRENVSGLYVFMSICLYVHLPPSYALFT